MRVLVTGAAGRVGSAVAAKLAGAGHEVTALDARSPANPPDNCRVIEGKFEQPEVLRTACEGVEAVLHLGAFMSWLPQDAEQLFSANVIGTRYLLEAAASAGVQRFVFASSGEVYPEGRPRYQPIDEQHPQEPASAYGLSKKLGEELVRFYERARGLPSVVLRFSHTQDAGELLDPDSFFSGPRFFLRPKIRQQTAFGNEAAVAALGAHDDGREQLVLSCNDQGHAYKMMITDTRDIVAGVLLALEHPDAVGQTFNLGADEPVDFADAVPLMGELTGLPVVRVDLPGPGLSYETSNAKVRERLGFRPAWTFADMVTQAADARTRRAS
ncbi:MAG: NAD(P)-dependent oxidoreductase [Pseudomonadota bacterium]